MNKKVEESEYEDLEEKMKRLPSEKHDNCRQCGNPWFFVVNESLIECTTCGARKNL